MRTRLVGLAAILFVVMALRFAPELPVAGGPTTKTIGEPIQANPTVGWKDTDVYPLGSTADTTERGLRTQPGDPLYPDQTAHEYPWEDYLFSRLIGGSGNELGRFMGSSADICVDSDKNTVVVGCTLSDDFPMVNADNSTYGGGASNGDAFVAKLASDGSIVWSTYLGGSADDYASCVALTDEGDVLVAGGTRSTNFPTTAGAWNESHNGHQDVFVTRYTANGNMLWSTYIGGVNWDYVTGIAENSQGEIVIAGHTIADFPMLNSYNSTRSNSEYEGYVATLTSDGHLVWSTYMGGGDAGEGYAQNRIHDLALCEDDSVIVTGWTDSLIFPTTEGAWDRETVMYDEEAFIAKYSSAGSLTWSTFYGENDAGGERGYGIVLDASENVILTGYVNHGLPGWRDVFVTKMNAEGTALLWDDAFETAAHGIEMAMDIAMDQLGHVFIVGNTEGVDFPTTLDAFDDTLGGTDDGFILVLDQDGYSAFSTYYGSEEMDTATACCVDADDNLILAGGTATIEMFPLTMEPLSAQMGDVFVSYMNYSFPPVFTHEIASSQTSDSDADSLHDTFTLSLAVSSEEASLSVDTDFQVHCDYGNGTIDMVHLAENNLVVGNGTATVVSYVFTVPDNATCSFLVNATSEFQHKTVFNSSSYLYGLLSEEKSVDHDVETTFAVDSNTDGYGDTIELGLNITSSGVALNVNASFYVYRQSEDLSFEELDADVRAAVVGNDSYTILDFDFTADVDGIYRFIVNLTSLYQQMTVCNVTCHLFPVDIFLEIIEDSVTDELFDSNGDSYDDTLRVILVLSTNTSSLPVIATMNVTTEEGEALAYYRIQFVPRKQIDDTVSNSSVLNNVTTTEIRLSFTTNVTSGIRYTVVVESAYQSLEFRDSFADMFALDHGATVGAGISQSDDADAGDVFSPEFLNFLKWFLISALILLIIALAIWLLMKSGKIAKYAKKAATFDGLDGEEAVPEPDTEKDSDAEDIDKDV